MKWALISKLKRHWRTLLPVLWGPLLGIMGVAVGTRLVTQVVSPTSFGEIKLVQGAIGLGIALVCRPFAQFAMRAFHDAREHGTEAEFVSYCRRTQLVSALILAALTAAALAVAHSLGFPVSLTSCIVSAATLVAEATISLDLAFAQTRNEQARVSGVEAARQWGTLLVGAGAVFLVADIPALFLFGQVVFTAASATWLRFRTASGAHAAVLTPVQRSEWKAEALRVVMPMFAAGLFTWIMNLGDRFLMARYCPASEVGRYAAVYGLVSMPIVASGGMLARAAFPFVFRAAARGDHGSQRVMLRTMFVLSSAIGALAVLGTMLVGPWALRVVLAPEYREGSQELLIWLAAAHACLIVSFSLDMRAYAQKKPAAFAIASGLAAASNIATNLVLIPKEGALGAAKATLFAYAVYLVAVAIVLRTVSRDDASVQPERPASSRRD